MPSPSHPAPSTKPSVASRRPEQPDIDSLSPEARAMLEAGIRSAQECPEGIYRGSFAQYADDE